MIPTLPEPELFGFTDVTSNAAPEAPCALVDCALVCACKGPTVVTPTANGTAKAAEPATASKHFFQPFRPGRISLVMMCSIRCLSSEPVTPDTQASGDPSTSGQ